MPGKLNSWIRAFFTLNKSEQRGIVVLVSLIILIGLLNLLLPYLIESDSKEITEKHGQEIAAFLQKQSRISDSIANNKLSPSNNDTSLLSDKFNLADFDPNNLSKEQWRKMGFAENQISNIKNYEAAGGKFRTKSDLKKIYAISEAEYLFIEPYIVISSQNNIQPIKSNDIKYSKSTVEYQEVELNSADTNDLISSLGFPRWLAIRTLKYRSLLGGFYNIDQLKEVYGMKNEILLQAEEYIVIDTGKINRLDINNIEFKELVSHPYFDYELTKLIFDARRKNGAFNEIDQLKLIDGISDVTFSKVHYYLYIRAE